MTTGRALAPQAQAQAQACSSLNQLRILHTLHMEFT